MKYQKQISEYGLLTPSQAQLSVPFSHPSKHLHFPSFCPRFHSLATSSFSFLLSCRRAKSQCSALQRQRVPIASVSWSALLFSAENCSRICCFRRIVVPSRPILFRCALGLQGAWIKRESGGNPEQSRCCELLPLRKSILCHCRPSTQSRWEGGPTGERSQKTCKVESKTRSFEESGRAEPKTAVRRLHQSHSSSINLF